MGNLEWGIRNAESGNTSAPNHLNVPNDHNDHNDLNDLNELNVHNEQPSKRRRFGENKCQS